MKTGILCTILFCSASVGFVFWRVHAVRAQPTPHFAIVEDPSLSHPKGCEAVLGLAEQALRTEGVSSGSTLTVLVIGDQATANEPWQLGRYDIPKTRKVLEGRSANLRRQQDVLRDIRTKCETVRRTTISPIFLGVTQAIADLRAHGCKETSQCWILVDSDLEENVEISIKEAISRARSTKLGLPPLLDNQGIEMSFCGLAVTAGRIANLAGREIQRALPRNSGRDDRLRQVWRSLFTQPDHLNFEPYCPQRRD